MRTTIGPTDVPNCHNEEILYHLLYIGPISSIVAIKDYGITRLAARIHNIRKEGFEVQSTKRKFTTRHGKKASYSEYFLIKKDEKTNRD